MLKESLFFFLDYLSPAGLSTRAAIFLSRHSGSKRPPMKAWDRFECIRFFDMRKKCCIFFSPRCRYVQKSVFSRCLQMQENSSGCWPCRLMVVEDSLFPFIWKNCFSKKDGKKSGGATNNVCVLPLHQSKKLCFKKLFQAAAVVIVGASAFLHTRHFTPVSSSFFLYSLFFISLWSLFPLRSPANWPCMNAAFHCAYTRVFFFFFRSLIFSSVLTRVFFLFVCLF